MRGRVRKEKRKVLFRRLRRLAKDPTSLLYFAACVSSNVDPEAFLQSKGRRPHSKSKKGRKLRKAKRITP